MAAWLRINGNAVVLINVVTLRRARLVLGWVTVRGYIILVYNQSYPGLLSLAIPPWIGTISRLLAVVLATAREETVSSA